MDSETHASGLDLLSLCATPKPARERESKNRLVEGLCHSLLVHVSIRGNVAIVKAKWSYITKNRNLVLVCSANFFSIHLAYNTSQNFLNVKPTSEFEPLHSNFSLDVKCSKKLVSS